MIRIFIKYTILVGLLLFIASCGTNRIQRQALYDPKEVSQLSRKLGIPISNMDKEDDKNMPLYAEVSLWLGTPYRYGGLSRSGVDCSGFTYLIYQKVYRKKLPRSTSELYDMQMHRIKKGNLRTGDLVFFTTTGNKKKVSHAGIYLKDGFFVHASTSRGVVVSHLDEAYYQKTWKSGGRL